MASNKNSSKMAIADCNKCGIKHARPVGVRCRRNLNVSAPPAEGYSTLAEEVNSGIPGIVQPSTSAAPSGTSTSLLSLLPWRDKFNQNCT